MKTSKTTMIGTAVAVMIVAVFTLAPVGFAQDGEKAADKTPESDMGCKMSGMPMMAHRKTMSKIKTTLEEAKNAAEASGDKIATAKIDEALKLIEQDRQAMRKHMDKMMQKMKRRMKLMQDMEGDMEKMKQEMGKKEDTKPMQKKMGEMKQKMQKMHAEMKSEIKTDKMKSPMNKKMMAAQPKVVNTICPIMENKIDPNKVPDNLTREYEGKKIGFCCAGCPAAWDKLSDAEKKAKLDAAMDKSEKNGTVEK